MIIADDLGVNTLNGYDIETEKDLGYNDWRLPNAKELQSILDYSNYPQSSGKAAINDIF